MRIEEDKTIHEITDEPAVERLIHSSSTMTRELWLSHNDDKYPAINMLINGECAYIHYFPEERNPGFRSTRHTDALPSDGITSFCVAGDQVEVTNDAVVTIQDCVNVAKEFLSSKALPKCLDWWEL